MAAPEPNIVIALESGWFGLNGESVRVLAGDAFAKDDPIVKKYPKHFGPQTVAARSTRVEQATAAPGEKR